MDRTKHQPIGTPEAPPTLAQVAAVLHRMDILTIAKQYGFIPIGEPDPAGRRKNEYSTKGK